MLTTSLPHFRKEIQFALGPFRSLLIRASQLFSFPAGTKMFQFPAYISSKKLRDSRIKACMQLPETFRSLPRLFYQNQAIHLTA